MTTAELMNKNERLLIATKSKLKSLKYKGWTNDLNRAQRRELDTQIEQTEAEIIEHRKTLKLLYQTI